MEARKILLIGKTGDGKSSTGNTILGEKVFSPKTSANSATTKCVEGVKMVNRRKITVIDTPGFFDTDRDAKEINAEIADALIGCSPALHAIVLVIKVGRYTKHENEVVQQFLNVLEEDALKHTVILFTFGEQLERLTIKEFMKDNCKLQELADKCGGRCHVIDNKYWNGCDSGNKSNKVQVKHLLETIDKMVEDNGCYTNELLQKLFEKIKEEVKNLPPGDQSNLPPEEKLEKAKEIFRNKFRNQVVGAVTGVLTGALLGVGVGLFLDLHLLKGTLKVLIGKTGAAVAEGAAVAGGAEVAGGMSGASTSVGLYVVGVTTVVGAAEGGVTGWKAADEADSASDAMNRAADANYQNAKIIIEKVQEFSGLVFSKKTD